MIAAALLFIVFAGLPDPPRVGMTSGAAVLTLMMAMPVLSGVAFGMGQPGLGAFLFLPSFPLSMLIGFVVLAPVVLLGFAVVAALSGMMTLIVRTIATEAREAAEARRRAGEG